MTEPLHSHDEVPAPDVLLETPPGPVPPGNSPAVVNPAAPPIPGPGFKKLLEGDPLNKDTLRGSGS